MEDETGGTNQWRTQEKFRRVQVYGCHRRGWGGESPPPTTPKNRRKIGKDYVRKLQQFHYFSLISALFALFQHYFSSKKLSKPGVKFSRIWTKNTIGWEICEQILKSFDEN